MAKNTDKSKETKDKETEPQAPKPQKPTAFDMASAFFNQNPFALVNIEGTMHCYDPNKGCYCPVEKKWLENYLFSMYPKAVAEYGSLQIVKNCAEILIHTNLNIQTSAEKAMILCLNDGYYDLNDLGKAFFILYKYITSYQSQPIFCTCRINANGQSCPAIWEGKKMATPAMDYYLSTIANGNPQIVKRIWQAIGYLLTPDNHGKCFFILQGVPNSGKSVLGNFIQMLFPENRIASLDIDQLGKRTATSYLVNKSLNLSMDLPNKTLPALAIRNIKLMTGNDDITVENENGKFFRYHGCCKFLFATNHPLTLKGYDPGLEDRIVCIPFTQSIAGNQRNPFFLNSLTKEKDNIVAKALAYYYDLRLSNYRFEGSELDICKPRIRYLPTEAEDSDAHLCEFVDTKCTLVAIDEGKTFTSDLHNAYLKFCSEEGYTPLNDVGAFSRRLHKCYAEQIEKAKWREGKDMNQNGFKGILLNQNSAE